MEKPTDVFLFGSLSAERSGTHSPCIPCDLRQPTSLPDLLERLRIQPSRVQLVMVNHRAAPPDQVIQPGDRVALFPREYAIFADWKNLRTASSLASSPEEGLPADRKKGCGKSAEG
jgi:sulfur carrier protein ThiS